LSWRATTWDRARTAGPGRNRRWSWPRKSAAEEAPAMSNPPSTRLLWPRIPPCRHRSTWSKTPSSTSAPGPARSTGARRPRSGGTGPCSAPARETSGPRSSESETEQRPPLARALATPPAPPKQQQPDDGPHEQQRTHSPPCTPDDASSFAQRGRTSPLSNGVHHRSSAGSGCCMTLHDTELAAEGPEPVETALGF